MNTSPVEDFSLKLRVFSCIDLHGHMYICLKLFDGNALLVVTLTVLHFVLLLPKSFASREEISSVNKETISRSAYAFIQKY